MGSLTIFDGVPLVFEMGVVHDSKRVPCSQLGFLSPSQGLESLMEFH